MGLVPGLPKLPFFIVGGILVHARPHHAASAKTAEAAMPPPSRRCELEAAPADPAIGALAVDPLELSIGFGLVPLVDARVGRRPARPRRARSAARSPSELGIVIAPVRIHDEVSLDSHEYVIKVRGAEVARSRLIPGHRLAMDPGDAVPGLAGIPTTEPAFGLPAVWIDDGARAEAEALGYTVVDGESVIVTHLTETIRRHADELLTRQETQEAARRPQGAELAPPSTTSCPTSSASARCSARSSTCCARASRSATSARSSRRSATAQCSRASRPSWPRPRARRSGARSPRGYLDADNTLRAISLDPALELEVAESLALTPEGEVLALDPVRARALLASLGDSVDRMTATGGRPVVVCSSRVRRHVRQLVEQAFPQLAVVSYNEIVRRHQGRKRRAGGRMTRKVEMSNGRHGPRTYRGGTLEEVLPRIREELGPDAVIVRQREGDRRRLRRLLRQEAASRSRRARPRCASPSRRTACSTPTTRPSHGQQPEEERNALLQTLLDQSSPFAVELSGALHVEPPAVEAPPAAATPAPEAPPAAATPAPEAPPAPPAPVQQMPAWVEALEEDWSSADTTEQPAVVFAEDGDSSTGPGTGPVGARRRDRGMGRRGRRRTIVDAPRARLRGSEPFDHDAATARAVRAELLDAGFSSDVADDLLAEARRTLRPFNPSVPLDILVKRALIRRIKVDAGWDRKRRTITLIGTSGAGRTLTAAKLCNAYAGAGRKVKALSLESARDAMKLALADAARQHRPRDRDDAGRPPARASGRRRHRRDRHPGDRHPQPGRVRSDGAPAQRGAHAGDAPAVAQRRRLRGRQSALITVLSGPLTPSRIVVTGADRDAAASGPVSLSLEFDIPISFVADGPHASSGVHPAEADELGDLAFP